MGHLINPTALRLGWFTNWCDSWFSDFVYYPEFLHDVFRIRLYLNFIFYRGFFMKKGLLFSHFELFFKYNYLFVRFYYYDGALMAGLYAFDGEFMNRFFRKSFYYLRRRQLLYEKNRYVTLFLGLFFSLFSFTDFFQKAYLDSITFDEHSYLKKFCYELPKGGFISSSKLDVLRKRLFSKKRKIKKIKVAKARGSLFFKRSPFRFQSGDSFLTYNKAFPWKQSKDSFRRKWEPRGYTHKNPAFAEQLHEDDIQYYTKMYPTFRFYMQRGWIHIFKSVISDLGKTYYLYNTPWFKREFLGFLQKHTIRQLLFYGGPGSFDNFLSIFFYADGYRKSPYKFEFKFLILFITLFKKVWLLVRGQMSLRQKERKFSFFRNAFFSSSFLFFFRAVKFRVFSNFVASLVSFLVPQLAIKVGAFLLSNDTVTARFLSAFIGRRLTQGYTIRQVLSPVLKDLYSVAVTTKMPKTVFSLRISALKSTVDYRKVIVKASVRKYIYIYKRLFFRHFNLTKSWLNFHSFSFLHFFYKKLNFKKSSLIGVSKSFLLRRASFLFFFNFDFSVVNNNFFFLFNELFFDFALKGLSMTSIFFFFIVDDLFSNFNVIFFSRVFKLDFLVSFFVANVFFNRLIQYNYSKYNYNWLIAFNKLSKLQLRFRDRVFYDRSNLLGYKVHLRGRFSRKQRASSLWFVKGLVSLNTLEAPIDYSFYALPVRNSLASIKVWLYKDRFYPKWFIRQF